VDLVRPPPRVRLFLWRSLHSRVLYTEQTAYQHARIWAELEASGRMIGSYDLIVAATALERGSVVATFNKRHFAQIRGLGIVEPTWFVGNSTRDLALASGFFLVNAPTLRVTACDACHATGRC
jgi:hypothetical protein